MNIFSLIIGYLNHLFELPEEFLIDRGSLLLLPFVGRRHDRSRRRGRALSRRLNLLRRPVVNPTGDGDTADIGQDDTDIDGVGDADPLPRPLRKL